MQLRRTFTLVGALTAVTPTLAAAPDTGWAGAIGLLLLLGVILTCVVTGVIGYALGHATRYKSLFALTGALIPIAAIVVYFWNYDRKSNESRAALIEANKAVIRLAESRIAATCADLQARESRAVDFGRALHRRVIPQWPALNVPPSAMDWPLPLGRVTLAFDMDYQDALRRLRFEQSYFERHRANDMGKEFDYVEHTDENGRLYAMASAAYWRALLPRLDDESRQEVSRTVGQGAADHFIGHRPRKPLARYGLEISDASTREDRNHWTALLRVKVFDTTSGEELFSIERALPILIDSLGDLTGAVRLCTRPGHDAVVSDRNFDWLGYLAREVSLEPRS